MRRRDVVWSGMNAVALATLPRIRMGAGKVGAAKHRHSEVVVEPQNPDMLTTLYDPKIQAMAKLAVEAAQRAGAQYADIRCTNIINRQCPGNSAAVRQDVTLFMSVRSLVHGYWGWSSTNMLSFEEAVRIGRLSAHLATEAATRGRPRTVDFGTIPIVRNETWETPVEVDPFTLKLTEVYDWLKGIATHLSDRGYAISISGQFFTPGIGVGFARTERLFASSEGSFTTQTLRRISPSFSVGYRGRLLPVPGYNRVRQGGWELLSRHSDDELYALVEAEREKVSVQRTLSVKPADIGRYDIVYSAAAMAKLLGQTLVPATEIDRAMGYEANASGTSYLGPDPLKFLGTQIASPVVTVMAERSTPDATATVKWDDEGVTPEPFTLVKNGMLIDYQTTREQTAWLAPWYKKQGRPMRSNGCAGAPSAGFVTMQHTPNIVLQSSTASTNEDALIAQMGTGLYVPSLSVDMDFQCSNGMGRIPVAFEIRNGKRAALVRFPSGPLGTLFKATELWKNVLAVGGAGSAEWFDGARTSKGDPDQPTPYSIYAVPALVKAQAIIDPSRKA